MAKTVAEMALAFGEEMERAREAAAGFRDLAETITDFDTMRYLLINRFGWTYGHASDCIELLEKMTGITLER